MVKGPYSSFPSLTEGNRIFIDPLIRYARNSSVFSLIRPRRKRFHTKNLRPRSSTRRDTGAFEPFTSSEGAGATLSVTDTHLIYETLDLFLWTNKKKLGV